MVMMKLEELWDPGFRKTPGKLLGFIPLTFLWRIKRQSASTEELAAANDVSVVKLEESSPHALEELPR